MKNVNKIFEEIDITKHFTNTLLDILLGSTPVCMYTYDTARTSYNDEFYVKYDGSLGYDLISPIISDLYGMDRMDNKITLMFLYQGHIPIFISYWDGSVVISNKVWFLSSVEGDNSYRVVEFKGMQKDVCTTCNYEDGKHHSLCPENIINSDAYQKIS